MNSLQRMIIIPPELFLKFKKLIEENKNLSLLDQNMKKILYDSNIKPEQKWYLYRQNLIKYGINKRQSMKLSNDNDQSRNKRDFGTLTNKILQRDKEIQAETVACTKGTQYDSFDIPLEDDVFEYNPEEKKQLSTMDIDFNTADNDYEEELVKKLAKMETAPGEKLTERPFLNSGIRLFETDSGSVISVATPKRAVLRSAGAELPASLLSSFPEKVKKRKLKTLLKTPPKHSRTSPQPWTEYK